MKFRSWWVLRVAVLAAVILSMGWLSYGSRTTFASPDESANAFFAQTFAETGALSVSEPLNAVVGGIIHPRSTVAPGTSILPASFLGFPIATGVVRCIFGTVGELAFTPIVALCAVIAMWWTVKTLTKDEIVADLSALFMLTHPAFWYYGARVMMPNVAFVSLLVISVALFVRSVQKKSTLLGLVAGIVIGIGLSMRLVELPILLVVLSIVAIVYRKSLPIRSLVAALIGMSIVLIGYVVINAQLYGSILATGYTLPNAQSVPDAATTSSVWSSLAPIGHMLLPFGFHPRAMLANAYRYGWELFPAMSLFAVLGAWFAWKSKESRKAWRTFLLCLVVASAWMIVVYGSWQIADNPDPKAITIGNSHVRYWLPLFVASSVLTALAVVRITRMLIVRMKTRHHNISYQYQEILNAIGLVVLIVLFNAHTVFAGPDGLLAARAASDAAGEKQGVVIANTESDAVVIVDRADKYVFPYRRVIVPLRADSTYAAMPTLVPLVPLYYFGITFPDADLVYLNAKRLGDIGLAITPVVTIRDETLYRIGKRQ